MYVKLPQQLKVYECPSRLNLRQKVCLVDMVMSEPPPERAQSRGGGKCNGNVKRGKEYLIRRMMRNHLFSS